MSVNRERSHLIVLPEDDANRQIANGFLNHVGIVGRSIQLLKPAGGWTAVKDQFTRNHEKYLRTYEHAVCILIVDFDGEGIDRLQSVRSAIAKDIAPRVFILGAQTEPEGLKATLNSSFEKICSQFAEDCVRDTQIAWRDEHLVHNAEELIRLRAVVKDFLFVDTPPHF